MSASTRLLYACGCATNAIGLHLADVPRFDSTVVHPFLQKLCCCGFSSDAWIMGESSTNHSPPELFF